MTSLVQVPAGAPVKRSRFGSQRCSPSVWSSRSMPKPWTPGIAAWSWSIPISTTSLPAIA
ncbi:hypothetical protein [Leifsonia sp. P73]|uniref:hypothetical protein n=1 Tax=Leifsonia sp. P73 TaxID=3423959 RepID=UPI003DA6036B